MDDDKFCAGVAGRVTVQGGLHASPPTASRATTPKRLSASWSESLCYTTPMLIYMWCQSWNVISLECCFSHARTHACMHGSTESTLVPLDEENREQGWGFFSPSILPASQSSSLLPRAINHVDTSAADEMDKKKHRPIASPRLSYRSSKEIVKSIRASDWPAEMVMSRYGGRSYPNE